MTLTRAHLVLIGTVVVALGFALWNWLDTHDSEITAKFQAQQLAAQKVELQKQVDALTRSVEELRATVDARDKIAQAEVAALVMRQNQVKTPEQAIAILRQQLPEIFTAAMQAPAGPTGSAPGQADAAGANLSNVASAPAVLPPENLLPLSHFVTKCKQDEILLGACKSNLDSVKEQVTLLEREKSLVQQQNEISEKQTAIIAKSKGSGFWSRAKWFVIGGSAGAGVVGGLMATR